MSESARKRQRTTPRNSEGPAETEEETLYGNLRQLAGIIPKPVTPYRRASSAGPTPGSRRTPNTLLRTPGTAVRTPRGGPATRPIPARRTAPTTPHAIRALRERANAARTPGVNRRRSGRVQRETPRDMLRALSRTLATVSKPIEPSPGVTLRPSRHSALDLPDIEDGPDPAIPRLSMPLDDIYEDDSIHEAPPRQSLLPELPDDVDNGTVQSLEFGRRALSEDPRAMARVSERFADFSELGVVGEEYEIDGAFINRRPTEDPDQALRDAINQALDDTEDLDALTGRQGGRQSDVDLGVFGDMDEPDEPTFRFTIPPRIPAPALEEQDDREGQNFVEEEYLNVEDDMDVQEEELEREHDADTEAGAEATIQSGMEDEGNAQPDDMMGSLEIAGWESENHAEEDAELQAYREEESALDRSLQTPGQEEHLDTAEKRPRRQRKEINVSQFGHEYPSFPAATVKRIASSLAKSQSTNAKISKDTLSILVQTTNLFFEHISGDLAAYAKHAGRKSIEDADVVALMKRQRLLTKNTTSFSLAEKMLPRELLQELRMEPVKLKRQKRKRMEPIEEEEEEEEG